MAPRILVIEDNPANLELMIYLLSASGYPTLRARDGQEGLRLAHAEVPDLIICDVQMPGMNGYEVAQQVHRSGTLRHIPLLAVTAFARPSDRDNALAAGFDGYLSKPIDPEEFVKQVEAFLKTPMRAARSVPTAFAEAAPSQAPTKGQTILILDNLQENLDLSSSLLSYSGYSTVTAQSVKEALRLARQATPDLILSDVCMPEGSGYDFIAEVKKDPQLTSIPFVFLTSTLTSEKARQRGLALGAMRFLFRPIEPEHLLSEIEACLFGSKRP